MSCDHDDIETMTTTPRYHDIDNTITSLLKDIIQKSFLRPEQDT